MKPRAITGVGIVSPIGTGRLAVFDAVRRGRRAERLRGRGDAVDLAPYPGACVTEVDGFDAVRMLGDKGLRPLDRLSKLLIAATRLALEDIELKRQGAWVSGTSPAGLPWPERVGLVVSNAYGSLEAIHELDRVALLEDARYINPSRFPLTVSNSAAGYASIWEDVRALNVTVSDGNCGALDAVQCADLLFESDRADVLLVGGAEALSEALLVAFRRLGFGSASGGGRGEDGASGSSSSSSPALGEGAALVALEPDDQASARGLEPLARVLGYGTAFDPPERATSVVHASAFAMQRAVQLALDDAGLEVRDVDLVVSGVSGLRAFDAAEFEAIERLFGSEQAVVAPKLAIGETLDAAGAMAIVMALAYLAPFGADGEGLAGAAAPGADGAPAYRVRGAVRGPVRTAVITSMGYHGNASALVMQRSSR